MGHHLSCKLSISIPTIVDNLQILHDGPHRVKSFLRPKRAQSVRRNVPLVRLCTGLTQLMSGCPARFFSFGSLLSVRIRRIGPFHYAHGAIDWLCFPADPAGRHCHNPFLHKTLCPSGPGQIGFVFSNYSRGVEPGGSRLGIRRRPARPFA